MKTVRVSLGSGSYEIRIGPGLLAGVGRWLKESGFPGRLVIVTDPAVNGFHGQALARRLAAEGFEAVALVVPAGEEQKTLETVGRLYAELTAARAERGTPVLALGGGVIGDLGGFVAATYYRGVPLLQLPTTLLAQVDSSIGGKVAVDHGQLKNKIGTFYQPRLVVADIDALKTLPAEEMANGMAEVIKSAAIGDRAFFTYLEKNVGLVKGLDPEVLEEVVFRTARIKAGVVEKDERDMGLRGILNFGHTVGHAVESVSGFGVKHGGAVAIGMVAAARISAGMGLLAGSEVSRLIDIIRRAGLPTSMKGLDVPAAMAAMRHDKKVRQDKIRFVLLNSIGSAFIADDVSPELVKKVLEGNE
ncbi:MAG: 3-dehydroquinate synthase [Chloroflexota bacterium]